MSLILSGSDGLSDVDGSAATPAIRGTDTNTGIFFGSDIIGFSEGGVEAMRINASGVLVTTNDASISGLTVGKGGGAQGANTTVGNGAGASNTTGNGNIFAGFLAGGSNTTGTANSFVGGASALGVGNKNTTGNNNTAFGTDALSNNTTASSNTAVGFQAAYANTTGQGITAIGKSVLVANTTGNSNVGVGGTRDGVLSGALISNTTGSENVAMGVAALSGNTTGSSNVGLGHSALTGNTTASNNTAVGYQAGYSNTTGTLNTFIGNIAGYPVSTGTNNVMIGYSAGSSSSVDLTTGSNNICIGGNRASTSSASGVHQIVIGTAANVGGKGDSTGFISPNGGGVFQGDNSSSWSTTSDRRLKKNIVANNDGLDIISQIQVRNFEYRLPEEVTDLPQGQAVEKTGVQLGVIAQELQAICPDCVTEQSTGVLSVNTDELFWHMVNAIKQLKAEIDQLKGN